MSQYRQDLDLLIQNSSIILPELDDFSFRSTVCIENIFSGYTLVKFLIHCHFPATGIKVVDDLPHSYYLKLGVKHVLTSEYVLLGKQSDERPYAILIYTLASVIPSLDRIIVQAIQENEHYNKLCVVGSSQRDLFSEKQQPDVVWNFKASISSLSSFSKSKKFLKSSSISMEFINHLLLENTELNGPGNVIVLISAQLWRGISSLRNVIVINSCEDIENITPYNERNIIVVDSDPFVFRRILMRIYTGTFSVSRILVCEPFLRSWTFDPQFSYHTKSIAGKVDSERTLCEWKHLIENIPLVSEEIKVLHLFSRSDYDRLDLSMLPCTPNIALLSLRYGTTFPLEYFSRKSQKICLYQLYLLGYLDSSFQQYSEAHPFWKFATILNFKQLLDPVWISLASAVDCALLGGNKGVVAQILIFVALIFYCDTTSFKLSTLLYNIPIKYKAVESDIFTILNFIHNSPDAVPLKHKLDKIVRLFKKALHLHDNGNEPLLSQDLSGEIISCFKRSFFKNIGIIKQVDVVDNRDSISRIRIISSPKLDTQSISEVYMKIPESLREYYPVNQLIVWISLYQPLSTNEQVPFIGFKLSKSEILKAESYFKIT